MKTSGNFSSLHWLAALALPLALCVAAPARAELLRSEEQADASGLALVETAAQGSVDAAFQSARQLRREDDQRLATELEYEQQLLAADLPARGAAQGVQLVNEFEFGGCVTHEFRVRYAGGDLHWFLKFRRGSKGFYLYDLFIRGLHMPVAAKAARIPSAS